MSASRLFGTAVSRALLRNKDRATLRHPRTQPTLSADPVEKIGWVKLLGYRETWAYALGRFLIEAELLRKRTGQLSAIA